MKTKIKLELKLKSRTKKILAQMAVLFFVLFLATTNSDVVLAVDLRITPAEIIDLTNQSRKENKLLNLVANEKLAGAAEAKADDMFKFQYFDHNSPSGVTPWNWIKAFGYDYRYAGENLAIDFVTAEGAHKALMASDSHRKNILNPNYTEIGVAARKGIFEKNESIIIVMEFGTPSTGKVASVSENGLIENKKSENNDSVEKNNIKEKTQRVPMRFSPEKLQQEMDIVINDVIEETQKEKEELATASQPIAVSADFKKGDSQNENISVNENKKIIQLVGISAESVKKISLEKVYSENVYWESHSKRNRTGPVIIMSSFEQDKRIFNLGIFCSCVLLVLFMFESLYVFSNFTISKKFEIKKI